jgi:polysaccharide pyruvyl transferase WcaK-like protein
MKNFLTLNEGGSDNFGDQMISSSLGAILEGNCHNVDKYDFTRCYKLNRKIERVDTNKASKKSVIIKILGKNKALSRVKWIVKNTLTIVNVCKKKYDIAFIGGGQLILSNPIFPVAFFFWVFFLYINKTKIYVIGVGSGESFSVFEIFLYKVSLKKCNKVLLRDLKSIKNVRNKFNIRAQFIPDIAYSYSNFPVFAGRGRSKIGRSLVIGIVDYRIYKRYCNEMTLSSLTELEYFLLWKERVLKISDKFQQLNILASSKEDVKASTSLYNLLIDSDLNIEIKLLGYCDDLEIYVNILSSADSVMSARMHTLIMAQTMGCEVIPWIISKKIESYKEEYLHLNIENIRSKVTLEMCKIINSL